MLGHGFELFVIFSKKKLDLEVFTASVTTHSGDKRPYMDSMNVAADAYLPSSTTSSINLTGFILVS